MRILIDDANAISLLAGTGLRVVLFLGPDAPQEQIARFSSIRWPAGVMPAVLPVASAPQTAARLAIRQTPAVAAILNGQLLALEMDSDTRAAAVRVLMQARAGPRALLSTVKSVLYARPVG